MPGFPPLPDLVGALLAVPFGLIVGSFANVVIHRLPLEESIVFPASRCPRCRAAIRPWQNVPVISWFVLRGRCASCREQIPFRYPAVEALHGIGFALVVLRFGLRPFTLLMLLLFFVLVVLAFIDWDHQILPDVITLPGILAGLFGSLVPGALIGWREAALGAVFGYVAFFLVAEGYTRIRGIEGLGQGDWKLAAMMGAFMGGERLMLTVFLGSVSGMAYGLTQALKLRAETTASDGATGPDEAQGVMLNPNATEGAGASEPVGVGDRGEPPSIGKYKLPFGTFLAASAIFVLLCGDPILGWYASFFRG
jgi:leader peptidase (prepilin peptidase)/N-methyltransferase